MSGEANKAIVRRFIEEVCNARRLEVADELIAPNHVYHDPSVPGEPRGPEGLRQVVSTYQNAFQGATWGIDDLIAEGDRVALRWTGSGTHTGELPGIPPTGKQARVPGLWVFRLANGKVVESWNVWDTLGMMQQLGVIPTAPQPELGGEYPIAP